MNRSVFWLDEIGPVLKRGSFLDIPRGHPGVIRADLQGPLTSWKRTSISVQTSMTWRCGRPWPQGLSKLRWEKLRAVLPFGKEAVLSGALDLFQHFFGIFSWLHSSEVSKDVPLTSKGSQSERSFRAAIRFFSLHAKTNSGNNSLCNEVLFDYIENFGVYSVIAGGGVACFVMLHLLVSWCVACFPPTHTQHERIRAPTPIKYV